MGSRAIAFERRGGVGFDEGGEVVSRRDAAVEEGAGEASEARLERLERRLERAEGEEESPEAPEGSARGRGAQARTARDSPRGRGGTAEGQVCCWGRSHRRRRGCGFPPATRTPRRGGVSARRLEGVRCRGGRGRGGVRGRPRGGLVVPRGARSLERELRLDPTESRGGQAPRPRRPAEALESRGRASSTRTTCRRGYARGGMSPGREQVSWLSSSTPPTCSCDKLVPRRFAESPRQTSTRSCVRRRYTAPRVARIPIVFPPPSRRSSSGTTTPVPPAPRSVFSRSRTSIRSRPRDAFFTPAIRTPRGAQEARPTRDHRRWRRYAPQHPRLTFERGGKGTTVRA